MPLSPSELTSEVQKLREEVAALRTKVAVLEREDDNRKGGRANAPLWAAVVAAFAVGIADLVLRFLGH
jgi:hypothetical protein